MNNVEYMALFGGDDGDDSSPKSVDELINRSTSDRSAEKSTALKTPEPYAETNKIEKPSPVNAESKDQPISDAPTNGAAVDWLTSADTKQIPKVDDVEIDAKEADDQSQDLLKEEQTKAEGSAKKEEPAESDEEPEPEKEALEIEEDEISDKATREIPKKDEEPLPATEEVRKPSPSGDLNDTHPVKSRSDVGAPKGNLALAILGNLIVPVALAFVVVWGYNWLIESAPTAEKQARARKPRLVEVATVSPAPHRISITAFGGVMPARKVEVKSQVSGPVAWVDPVHFQPGASLKADQEMLRIDDADYLLAESIATQAYAQAESEIAVLKGNLDDARAALSEEMGRQAVARKEYELLGKKITDKTQLDRLLRRPQLDKANSAVSAAEARMTMAEAAKEIALKRKEDAALDVKRTVIRAPFNAMVLERYADVGDQASASKPLALLYGSDQAWIEVTLPVESLQWLELPNENSKGSSVKVSNEDAWGEGVTRDAHILRVLPELSQGGRQARVLLAVEDPFSLKPENKHLPTLRFGSFVKVSVEGAQVPSAVKLPRDNLREGNRLWIAAEGNKLEIREVSPIYLSKEYVYVDGSQLKANERVVTSKLSTAVPNLALRVREQGAADNSEESSNKVAE